MSKSPAFRLYASDFYMATDTWTNEEVGAYFRLLLSEWVNGPLPNNEKKLQRILKTSPHKFKKIWENISHKFLIHDDGSLYNKRLEFERTKQIIFKEHQSNAGKRSARIKEARKKGTHTKTEWNNLLIEANNICPRCNNYSEKLDKDHVVPVYKGGSDSIQNIQPLCKKCNSQKGPDETDFFKDKRSVALSKIITDDNTFG